VFIEILKDKAVQSSLTKLGLKTGNDIGTLSE